MAGSKFSSVFLPLALILVFAALPAHAFGAGNIASISTVEGQNWRHGDVEDALLGIYMAGIAGGKKFNSMDVKRVYFGNWLRDYSQAVDVGSLKYVEGPTIRILLSILAFMTFGYATGEFEVTEERLGCYRPEEHIDNPKDYADNEDARTYDRRLRGPVDERIELAIDPQTGMKNYIANENIRYLQNGDPMHTSAGLVRHLFGRSIELGRRYGQTGNKAELYEALRLMGTGLHCLEDFSAHSNYIELALIELGETGVFPQVGSQTRCNIQGRTVYPLVTGTFGGVDFLHSVLGEASDKLIQSEVEQLEGTINAASQQSNQDGGEHSIIKDLFKQLKLGGSDELDAQATHLEQQSEAKKNEPWGIRDGGAGIRNEIMPFLEWHDKIMKAINHALEAIPGLTALVEKLSEAVSIFVFSLLAPYILPIVSQVKGELSSGSGEVIESARAKQFIVFENHHSSDPTHSMLSKDHFTNLLNEPAGKVASQTVKYVVPLLMQAWDDASDPQFILGEIIGMFHHPTFANGGDGRGGVQGRQLMFGTVRQWWQEMDESQRQHYRQALSREGVEQGRNHKAGHDSGHGCGKPIHRNKPKNSGGEFGGLGGELGMAMGGALEQAFAGEQGGGGGSGESGMGGFLGGIAGAALGGTLLGGLASGIEKETYNEGYGGGNVRSAERRYDYSGEGKAQVGERLYDRQESIGYSGAAAGGYSGAGGYGHSEQRYAQNRPNTPQCGSVGHGDGVEVDVERVGYVVPKHQHDRHQHHQHHGHHHGHHHDKYIYEGSGSYESSPSYATYTETPTYSTTSTYASESAYPGEYERRGEYPTNTESRTETYSHSTSYGGEQSSYEASTHHHPGFYETRQVVYPEDREEGYTVEKTYKKYSDGEEVREYKTYRNESDSDGYEEGVEEEFEEEREKEWKREKKWRKKHEDYDGSGDEGSGDEYYGSGDE